MSFGTQFHVKHFKPVAESAMQETQPRGTICCVLRQIYHKTDNEEVRELARLATAMAKRMGSKLNEYHRNFGAS